MFGKSELIEDIRREVCDLKASAFGGSSPLHQSPLEGLPVTPTLQSKVNALERKVDAIAEHLGCEFKHQPAKLTLETKDDSDE